VFVRIVFEEYLQNHCITRGAALAFALLLTLIPLLVCISLMMTKVMETPLPQVEKVVAFFLPFAPATVLAHLSTFFANAQKIKGLGIGILVIVTLSLFGTVEEALNTIWKVPSSRSFFVRLRTFTMVIVYSPILFIASFHVRRNIMPDVKLVYRFPLCSSCWHSPSSSGWFPTPGCGSGTRRWAAWLRDCSLNSNGIVLPCT